MCTRCLRILPQLVCHSVNVSGHDLTNKISGLIYSIISPLMLIFVSLLFSLLWIAYRHNYYYVQRNKVDTHGLLFNNAMSQLFSGVYVLEIALIGLFFLVRDTDGNVACSAQAIIMIVVLILTAVAHFILEQHMRPLYEFLPATLEDPAVDAERERFLVHDDNNEQKTSENAERGEDGVIRISVEDPYSQTTRDETSSKANKRHSRFGQSKTMSNTAANARKALSNMTRKTVDRVEHMQTQIGEKTNKSHRLDIADQLGAALETFPDELTDLSAEERDAELKAAFQDPVTREQPPVIWIPQDRAGLAEDTLRRVRQMYGERLEYSTAGAFLASNNKCEITQPAPDVRPDWLLEWGL